MISRAHNLKLRLLAAVFGITVVGQVATAQPAHSKEQIEDNVEIRRTSYGVPHILAADLTGAGFGLGYAFAQDNACEMTRYWLQTRGELSKTYGPQDGNLASDIFWARVNADRVVEKQLSLAGMQGPLAEVRQMTSGYVAGYNQYLKDVSNRLPDPRCEGAAGIGPISEKDVYLRALAWSLKANVESHMEAIAIAQPPGAIQTSDISSITLNPNKVHRGASNTMALGSEATESGSGMLLINPHWTWDAPFRFYEAHLTVPGTVNVSGMTSMGVPLLIIGFNDTTGWSHTYSATKSEIIYKLSLQPGKPTSYIWDGSPEQMKSTEITVEVKQPDGSVRAENHKMWDTKIGPVFASEHEPWTDAEAYVLHIKDMNLRWMNQEFLYSKAKNVQDIHQAGQQSAGWGFLNTAAADVHGQAFFGNMQSIPLLTDAQLDKCNVAATGFQLGKTTVLLDGTSSACQPGTDSDAIEPGVYSGSKLPATVRNDYTLNSNDTHWLSNLRDPLVGYPKIMGGEGEVPSLRTRNAVHKIEDRLNGVDGRPGDKFSLATFFGVTQDNYSFAGRIWRDDLVVLCRSLPPSPELPSACGALEQWDLTDDLDSSGAVLFHLFASRLDRPGNGTPEEGLFTVPFDAKDPVNTPRGLNTSLPKVREALIGAIDDLRAANAPMTATLRQFQYVQKGDHRIPIYGGPAIVGDFNLINIQPWDPTKGWALGGGGGASYQGLVEFTKDGPTGMTLLTASQSTNPDSPHFTDQTILFSNKVFKPLVFSEKDIAADPNLKITRFCKIKQNGGISGLMRNCDGN